MIFPFGVSRVFPRVSGFPEALLFCLFKSLKLTVGGTCGIFINVNKNDNPRGHEMKSYKDIAEAAGTTENVVRGIAKTITRAESTRVVRMGHSKTIGGGWRTEAGDVYRTKAEAIEAAAKAWQADVDARHAAESARLADYRAAQDLMAEAGVEIPADVDETARIADRLAGIAKAKGAKVADLTVDDLRDAIADTDADTGTEADADYTPRVYAPMDVEEIEAAACKAIDTHTPARIEADGVIVHDEIVAVHDIDAAVTTKHFGDLGTPGDVRPWDRAEGEPATMRTAYGALKAVRRVDFMHEWYESAGANRKGETLTVELDTIDHGGQPGYLLTEWARRGYVEPMAMAWCVNVYITDADGHVYQGCNPQITPGGEIAWAWILPATEANKNAILCEILERFGRAE